MSDGALVVVVVFVEMFLHYFPWRLILRGRELPRLVAYVLGVLGLIGPFTAWLIERGNIGIAIMLWIAIGSGGLAVAGLYLFDWVIAQVWGRHEAEQREKALMERADGKGKPS